jgi:hypothetical protein
MAVGAAASLAVGWWSPLRYPADAEADPPPAAPAATAPR